MRFHRFGVMLIYAARVRPIAQADNLFDEPLGNLNMDESNWNTESSLFDQVQSPNLSTEDNLISLNDDPSDLSLLAEDPTVCLDGYQPLSRIRARMGGYCPQHGEHPDGLVPGDNQLQRQAALTQEKINQENCPSDYYQGIFLIPLCSLYDSDMIRPSRGEKGVPIPESGLQDVWGQLMTPVSEGFSPCYPKRRWCCQSWLPREPLFSKYGYGLWCVQGPAAKFVNPVDMFPPMLPP